jgi:hypothetical protein
MKKLIQLACCIVPLMTACGGGGGGSSATSSSTATVSLSGVGSKGLFANADVQAFEVVNGALVSLGSSVKTGTDGSYTLSSVTSTSNPVVIKLTITSTTTMLDETAALGSDGNFTASSTIPPVGTVIRSTLQDLTTNSEVHITPFTEMAVSAAESTGTLNSASLLAGRQMVVDTLGLNPFTIKPVNASATMSTDQSKLMLLLTGVAQDAKTAASTCTGDASGVTCAISNLTAVSKMTKNTSGNYEPATATAFKTKVDGNITNVKAAITAGTITGTFSTNIKNQTISTATPTTVNPTTAAVMASLEGFVNTFRTGFNAAGNTIYAKALETQNRTNTIVLSTMGQTTGNIEIALRGCLNDSGFKCTDPMFTKTASNAYSFSIKSGDNTVDITGTISGSYDNIGNVTLSLYEVYKRAGTTTKLYEAYLDASGTGVTETSNEVTLNLTKYEMTGYDITSGSSKFVKVSFNGGSLTASKTNKTLSINGAITIADGDGDSFSGSLTAAGKQIKISPSSSTYDWELESAEIAVKAKAANSLLLGFTITAARDLSNYYPKLPETSTNIVKGSASATIQFTDNVKFEMSGTKTTLTEKPFNIKITTTDSWVNMAGTLTAKGNGVDEVNSDGTTVTSSGTYKAVVKSQGGDIYKGTTKIGEINSSGWFVDGKKFVVEPLTLDIGLYQTSVVSAAVAKKSDPTYSTVYNSSTKTYVTTCIANCT